MKTNYRNFLSVLAIAAIVSTAALTSCSDDEVTPVPDEVGSTIENAYYITGVVTEAGSALSGVAVTSGNITETTGADGVYTLKMSNSATSTVNFSMDGYISIDATAVFSTKATAGAVVTLSQELKVKAEAQAVKAGEDTVLNFDHESDSDIVLTIPATALTEDVDVSATYFTPAATEDAAIALAEVAEDGGTATITSSLMAVHLEPSGLTFETPATISIPGDYVEGAYHAKMVNGKWVSQGAAYYNPSSGVYEIEVDGFSQHSVAVDSEVSASAGTSSTVELKSKVYDNIGMANAISATVNYDQYSGWKLSDSSSSTLSSYVAGLMGSSAGVTTIAKSLDVTIAGDEKATVAITQQVVTTSYSLGSTSVSAKSYGDVSVSVKTEQGDMRPDHN